MSGGMDPYLSLDEVLNRALRVAISSAIPSTSRVEVICITLGVHLREVQCAVDAAWHLGDIDIECELLIQKLEMLVRVLICHEIHSWRRQRSDIRSRICLVDVQCQCVAAGTNTIGGVIHALERACLCASLNVWAELFVESIRYAVGIAIDVVKPAIVGIEHDRRVLRLATP